MGDSSEVMAGVRVVEVATWAFVPSAGAVLAEWGADVIKVEDPTTGDIQRGVTAWGVGPEAGGGLAPLFQIHNRGKRSVGIDLRTAGGREALMRLVELADVFLTNFLPDARTRLGIDVDAVRARNPRIIYARGTAQGSRGPDRSKGGFDMVSYWSRSGASRGAMAAGHAYPVPMPGPGFGDAQGGLNLAAGISAALFRRERTGEGALVDTSLYGTGLWSMQTAMTGAAMTGRNELNGIDRTRPANPLVNIYATKDKQYLCLCMMESDRYWVRLCEVMQREDLVQDARFKNATARAENVDACVEVLDEIFAERSLEEWRTLLAEQEGQWEVVQSATEVLADAQVQANGFIGYVGYPNGVDMPVVRVPIQFEETATTLRAGPEHAAHTEEVLLEIGYDWDQIIALKLENCVA